MAAFARTLERGHPLLNYGAMFTAAGVSDAINLALPRCCRLRIGGVGVPARSKQRLTRVSFTQVAGQPNKRAAEAAQVRMHRAASTR